MPRKGISKEDVLASVKTLIEEGRVPTAAGIRAHLGRGSSTTIQKYFRAWKQKTFRNQQGNEEKALTNSSGSASENANELRRLQKRVLALEEQDKILAQELIKKEQENLKFYKENLSLTENLAELTEVYKALTIKFEDLSLSHEDLKNERETVLQKILEDKNRQLERLQLELKESHEAYLNIIRESGQQNDELIIQEKVKSINLADKLKELQAKNKQLEVDLEKENKIKEPLQKELKRQQALIQKYITWEQLQDFKQQNPEHGQ